MATWRPNETLYGPGGGEFVDDAGGIWPDPFGTLNAPLQVAAPVPGPNAGAPAQGAPGGGGMSSDPATVAAFQAATTPQPAPPPEAHAPPGLPTREADLTDQLDQGAKLPPTPQPGFADGGVAGGASTPPAPQPGLADTLETSSSGGSSEQGSTGLSTEAQQRQGANITAVAGAQAGARDAAAQYGTLQAQQAEAHSKELLAQAAEGVEKTAAQLAVQDHIQEQVQKRMNAGAEWRPDRSELFHNDHGVAFGLMAAVAAMAGAWMQGRGLTGQNPYLPTIMRMIDDNVQDQVRKNSMVMQKLREDKGDIKAAILELKQRQPHFAQMRLDGLTMKDQSDLMRAGVEKTRQDMQAQDAKWEQEKRQALERTETRKVTQTFSHDVKPNPAATAERNPQQARAESVSRLTDDLGKKAGLIRDKNGKWRVGGGAFPPALLEKLNPFSDDDIHSTAEQLAEQYGRLQSQGAIGVTERPELRDQVGMNTTTRAQLASKLNTLEMGIAPLTRQADERAHNQRTTIPKEWK